MTTDADGVRSTAETPVAAALRVAVAGASGRMGRMVIEAVVGALDLSLVGALDRADSPAVGEDATAFLGRSSGVTIETAIEPVLEAADVLIDFTQPAGTLAHVAACRRLGTRQVIGTTGLDEAGRRTIAEAAQDTAIVFAPNMSVGVNVMLRLVELATRALAADCDIEVIEAHHRMKVDAPSGTAIALAEVIARGLGRSLDQIGVHARHGHTGAREAGTIGFSVIRGGDIVGDHTVLYAATGERIEITHRSSSRATYAQGSIRACRFLRDKRRGLFDMQAVLGLDGR
ncbi:MAG: 4-hydroxy-tetrahydrodipicolinate reductase [Burkholderiaceae bacterium]